MKKKVLVVALSVVMIAILSLSSLAYFTAQDSVDNTFTVGSVQIDIYENDDHTPSATNYLGQLVPVVNTNDPSLDPNYIPKEVEVLNTGDNPAFIRLHLAFPTALEGYLHWDMNTTGWNLVRTSSYDIYTVYTYDFNAAVVPTESTSALLEGVYLGSDVDLEADVNGNLVFIKRDGSNTINSGVIAHYYDDVNNTYESANISILVAAEAIQSEGFENLTATQALNTGFGNTGNPWS